jgi:hypothetical protein
MSKPIDDEMILALIGAACARQSLPPAAVRWAAARVLDTLSLRERERARNAALRRAAELIPGTRWMKASTLRDESQQVAEEWTLHVHRPPAPATVESHLVTAMTIGDLPMSRKQLLRVLTTDD